MKVKLSIPVKSQPDDETCGPTCLQMVYEFLGHNASLDDVVKEVEMLEEGGTVAANLATHARNSNFETELYSYNLNVFDPSWWKLDRAQLIEKLKLQAKLKAGNLKLQKATQAYLQYLNLGGVLKFQDLSQELISNYIQKSTPIIAGLSSTYLYKTMRERPGTTKDDDVEGEPSGHFVIINGFDSVKNTVSIIDPYQPNPIAKNQIYKTSFVHLISSIFLGVMTYDANLLVLKPRRS